MIIQTTKQLRPRDEFDYYPTPQPFADAALGLLPRLSDRPAVLDPGAGAGVYGRAVRQQYPKAFIVGAELRGIMGTPCYNTWYRGDVLTLTPRPAFDLVIGNPPYGIAEDLVRFGLASLIPGGQLIFLLRLAFLEGQARGEGLWQEFPPRLVGVLSKRPSFTGNSKTDSTAYAYFCWEKGYAGTTELTWVNVGVKRKPKQLALFAA